MFMIISEWCKNDDPDERIHVEKTLKSDRTNQRSDVENRNVTKKFSKIRCFRCHAVGEFI